MIIRYLKILYLTAFALSAFAARCESSLVVNALDTLDRLLKNQQVVLDKRTALIDSIRQNLIKEPDNTVLARNLADAFRGVNNDSAIFYYNKVIDLAPLKGDTVSLRYALPELGERLGKALRLRTALLMLDTIDTSGWSKREKIHYFSSLSHIYIDAITHGASFYTREDLYAHGIASLDSLLVYLHGNKDACSLVLAQKYFLLNEPVYGMGELNDVFKKLNPLSPEYGAIAHMLASYYKDKPDHNDEYIYFLTLSAISDARHANGEAVSLALLGEELMKKGDHDRAFRYLTIAGDRIGQSKSTLYGAEITPSLSSYVGMWTRHEARIQWIYFIVVCILLLIIATLVILLIISHRRKHDLQEKFVRVSSSLIDRDHYINQLINLCGVYVEGLEEFNRLVARKLKVNQVQDLYRTIESGKMLQEQKAHFFEVFDDAVLKIYPDFIDEINSLLLEDKQVQLMAGGQLPPELRIIAFMRLGVTDSGRLSKFLGLSVNTVYTYRNRMKNRAKNRDTFEEDILNLNKSV